MSDAPRPKENTDHDVLILGGFQVFEELVNIPLAQLTLIFGPNSAGKSAIRDGLDLLRELFHLAMNEHRDPDEDLLIPLMEKSWRRTNGTPERLAEPMTLGFQRRLTTHGTLRKTLSQKLSQSKESQAIESDYRQQVSFAFEHWHVPATPEEFPVRRPTSLFQYVAGGEAFFISCRQNFYVAIDGVPLLRGLADKHLALNICHAECAGVLPESTINQLLAACLELNGATIEDGWLILRGRPMLHKGELVGMSFIDTNKDGRKTAWEWDYAPSVPMAFSPRLLRTIASAAYINMPLNPHMPSPAAREAYRKFAEVVATIIDFAYNILSLESRHNYSVPASRSLPSDSELTFLVPAGSDETPDDSLDAFSLPKFGVNGCWRSLAASLLPFDGSKLGGLINDDDRNGPELAERVNQILAEHLFIQSGYQLAVDARVILDLDQFANLVRPKPSDSIDYPVLVRLFLVDAKGRRFQFDDVGTGIGYVVPVLWAVSERTSSRCFIEQPELHLHPALQSALGDVFIEAINDQRRVDDTSSHKSSFVIETHSEHLLLRILKRIRQTASERPPLPELCITPNDLVVLYFDPSPEGTTKVKQLRIAPDGEFIDAWPRGFFEERYQELFDE